MDGNRPVADGRDIFESGIQDAVRRPRKFVFDWYRDVFLSDDDGETSDVALKMRPLKRERWETVFDKRDI